MQKTNHVNKFFHLDVINKVNHSKFFNLFGDSEKAFIHKHACIIIIFTESKNYDPFFLCLDSLIDRPSTVQVRQTEGHTKRLYRLESTIEKLQAHVHLLLFMSLSLSVLPTIHSENDFLKFEAFENIEFQGKDFILNDFSRRSEELRLLHDACFPIVYSPSYFEKLKTQEISCLIATNLNRIVAFGLIRRESNFMSCRWNNTAYITTFGVAFDFRRKGLGFCLLKNMLTFCRETLKVVSVTLHVMASNIGALKLYRNMGFSTEELVAGYYYIDGKYYDALYMRRKLDNRDDWKWGICAIS